MSKSNVERARIILAIARARRDANATNARAEVALASADLATAIADATRERIESDRLSALASLAYNEQRLIALDTETDTMTIDLPEAYPSYEAPVSVNETSPINGKRKRY